MSTRIEGCRARPLGSYLQGLGLWRALDRSGVGQITARWSQDRIVLDGAVDLDGIVDHLLGTFSPLPIVSPWNAGSGFARNGKSATAERLLERVRSSDEPRLAALRAAVVTGDAIVTEGLRRGWGGQGADLWDKNRKAEVVQLCRNLLADEAVPWIDAAVVLADEKVTFSRLLGTGGNFGRQDLSVTYIDHALAAFDDAHRSEALLRAALTADESVPYARGTVGQFDPGRAGGIQSSPAEKSDDKGFVNPWSALLTIEGALFFTSTVARREGSETARVAVPFQVSGTTSGFAGAALDEDVTAEIWTPTWSRPATIDEVRQLMRDGRAEWGNGPARSGLDFALAVRSLGTDRGIDRFTRHVVVNRLGQSPLAIPVDILDVPDDDQTSGLRPIDTWLRGVRRLAHLPRSISGALQGTEAALLRVSRDNRPDTRSDLIRRLGHLHRLVSRSGTARTGTTPLVLRQPDSWIDVGGPVELRLAVALASAHDDASQGLGIIRAALGQVSVERGRIAWAGRPSPFDLDAKLDRLLADVHVRRAQHVADDRRASGEAPAIKGICTGTAHGWWARPDDLAALCRGTVDLDETRELIDGLMLFDWRRTTIVAFDREARTVRPPPSLSLLLPFASLEPLPLADSPETGAVHDVLLRSSPRWPALLRADRVEDVTSDALQRLRAAGVRDLPPASSFRRGGLVPAALSAALLTNVSRTHRIAAVQRIATVPPTDPHPSL